MVESYRDGKWAAFRKRIFGKRPSTITFNVVLYVVFTLIAFCTLYPFLHVVIESLKSVIPTDTGIPKYTYNLTAYLAVFKTNGLMWSFLWSIIVVVVSVVTHVFFCMLTAYPLSKKQLKGRMFFLLYVLITMMFSGGLIPFYMLIQDLNLMDNPLVYVLPGLVSAFDVVIAKNFLQAIPSDLEESAKLDGASDYRIFFCIYLPLSLPIMATLALWCGVGKWNDWMTGVLYMANSPDLQLIQNYLRRMLIDTTSSSVGGVGDIEIKNMAASVQMATIVVGTLPIVLIYPFVQKYFVKGVILGSIKG